MIKITIMEAYPVYDNPDIIIIHTQDGSTYLMNKEEIQKLVKLI